MEPTREAMTAAANDMHATACRYELARFSSEQLCGAGTELHLIGHFIGPDRAEGNSPFGHGNDETVAVSVLLRVAGQLVIASADLFADGRQYAAAALLRQIVEIEYLAWAFETRNGDAERWLRSDQQERQKFFSPAKLRDAAQGTFRGKDYGYHCELGATPCHRQAFSWAETPRSVNYCFQICLGTSGVYGITSVDGLGKARTEDLYSNGAVRCPLNFENGIPKTDLLIYHHPKRDSGLPYH
jgi:hypothetical protein